MSQIDELIGELEEKKDTINEALKINMGYSLKEEYQPHEMIVFLLYKVLELAKIVEEIDNELAHDDLTGEPTIPLGHSHKY